MRQIVFVLGGLVAGLVAAGLVVAFLILGSGGNEEAYRQAVRPLLQEWQNSIGLTTLNCSGTGAEPATGQDVEALAGTGTDLSLIYRDVEALETPDRYQDGVDAMAAITAELEAIDVDRDELALALQGIAFFDVELALADLSPTPENQSWFLSAIGTFEIWGGDFQNWSDFIDCTLPAEPERVDELSDYMGQLEIAADQMRRLQSEGPQEMQQAFAPLLNGVEVTTQIFAGLSRALEHQVEVERVFADIIAEP